MRSWSPRSRKAARRTPTTTSGPPTAPVAVLPEEATLPAPPAAEAEAPARAPRSVSCDAVSDDLGTVEPGGTVAFRVNPSCPYRPGTVDIAINGESARPAQVDENGVVWVELGP